MLSRYKNSIIKMLNLLHKARKEPYKNINKWLELQEFIIKKICYVEKRIKESKIEVKSLNSKRKDPDNKLSRKESKFLKDIINTKLCYIKEYQRILEIFRSVGDGIAFTFINKYDIKPLSFKESSGFISGKKGFEFEKQILRASFKQGNIAILNDITSVLRYTDLTLITDNGIIPIEAKTGDTKSKRDRVQTEKTNKILSYLTDDYSDNLFDDVDIIKRVATVNPEKNYITEFNSLLSSAYRKGADLIKFEDGFICIATYENNDPELMEKAITGQGLVKPIAFYLNINKFAGKGYYPFSLLFNDPKFYYDFLVGELNIIFFLDFRIIEKIADKNGYVAKKMSNDSMYLSFSKIEKNSSINEYIMSDHYFFRSFMELVSIEWLIQDFFDRFKKK